MSLLFGLALAAATPATAAQPSPTPFQAVQQPAIAAVELPQNGGTEIRLADGTLVSRTDRSVSAPQLIRAGSASSLVAVWTETDGVQSQERYALRLRPDRGFSRARDVQTNLHLKRAGIVDPTRDAFPAVAEKLAVAGQMHIVQFVTQPIDAYTEELEGLGATVRHYLPESAHLVQMDAATAGEVAELPFVRWVGPYSAALRIEGALATDLADGVKEAQRVHIQVAERGAAQKDVVAERVEALGAEVVWKIDEGFRLDAVLTPDQVATVAGWDEVIWIDRWGAPEADMDNVRIDGGADALESIAGFTGTGVRAEAMDGNVDTGHPDLQSNPVILHGAASGWAGHGTPVTGIVFGDGAGNAARRGLMPDAQPIFASYTSLSNRYVHTQQLLQAPYFAVFQTNSWGDPRTALYTSASMEMDDILFQNDIVILQSQSNAGTTQSRPQAWAKNVVAVGGIQHQNTLSTADDSWGFSGSIGPASDGRIKPDLCHWYDGIFTAQEGGGSTQFGGTSAATPITAGFFGLFYEIWHSGVLGNTPGATVFDSRPKATLARAFIINAASRYDFSGSSADLTRTHQGWGRANVERIYTERDDYFWINESLTLQETDSAGYALAVNTGTPELAVTMVYLDVPATTSSTLHRINDLTLRVTAPDGTQYWGNNGLRDGNVSVSGGNSNTKDVVENVLIPNPMAGNWTVEIIADEINGDGHVETSGNDADFALVVRGTTGLNGTPCLSPVKYCPAEPNSFSVLGATLDAIGLPSVSGNNVQLHSTGLPQFTSAIVVRSEQQASVPAGDGTLCLGGTIYRLEVVQADFLGGAFYAIDTTTSPAGAAIVSGSTWNYQLWFRDVGGPGGTGYNFSEAIEVTWCE